MTVIIIVSGGIGFGVGLLVGIALGRRGRK